MEVGLDTYTVELTVKTLVSRLVTLERIRFSPQFFTDVTCPCRALAAARVDTPCAERSTVPRRVCADWQPTSN
eukprot:493007-Prorocentrum_minimum.AAC.1